MAKEIPIALNGTGQPHKRPGFSEEGDLVIHTDTSLILILHERNNNANVVFSLQIHGSARISDA